MPIYTHLFILLGGLVRSIGCRHFDTIVGRSCCRLAADVLQHPQFAGDVFADLLDRRAFGGDGVFLDGVGDGGLLVDLCGWRCGGGDLLGDFGGGGSVLVSFGGRCGDGGLLGGLSMCATLR